MTEPKDPRAAGSDEIAADDVGAGALGANTGESAGGTAGFEQADSGEQEKVDGDIAADDAGATAEMLDRPQP